MADWKKDLSKHSNYGGASFPAKKCEKCGQPLKDSKFKYCYKCNEAMKTYESGLTADYLAQGYFDEKGNLFERYIVKDGDADKIARQLGEAKPVMTNHQLRRFYSHVRAAENRLEMSNNFEAVYIDLKKLDPFVAEAKGKGKIPDLFYNFMTKNLTTVKTEKDFSKGFLEHFQAVVAFFTFHYPKK